MLSNYKFFKGEIAHELASKIIHKKYYELKNPDVIDYVWDKFYEEIKKLKWYSIYKYRINRNYNIFIEWFDGKLCIYLKNYKETNKKKQHT